MTAPDQAVSKLPNFYIKLELPAIRPRHSAQGLRCADNPTWRKPNREGRKYLASKSTHDPDRKLT